MAEFSKTAQEIEAYLERFKDTPCDAEWLDLLKKAVAALEDIALTANRLADSLFHADKEADKLRDRITFLENKLTEESNGTNTR